MPAQSKAQQRFMGMVHAAQKGEEPASPEVAKVAKDMDKSDAKDFASTKHKGLPNRVKQEILKRLKEYAIIGDKHVKYPQDNEPLRSNDEMDLQEDRIPQNFNVGVASDYHTKVATTPRKKYDDTNFDKETSGQPDLEEGSADELEMLKLTVRAMKTMPGSPKQKEIIKQLNALRVKNGLKPLAERYIKEWGSNLDNSYILNMNSKLDGTPEEKDAIDREIESVKKEGFPGGVGVGLTFPNGTINGAPKPEDVKKTRKKLDSEKVNEVGIGDWHFKAIKSLYQKAGSFGRKKIAALITKNPNSSWSKIEAELKDSDYSDVSHYTDVLHLENVIAKDGKILSNNNLIGYYEFDRDSDSFWVDDVKKGKGQLSFDTKKEVEDYFKKNEKDALKHLGKLRGESVNEVETPRGDVQVLKVLNNIVKTHSAEKVKDQKTGKVVLVDVQSANAVLKVYDALSTANKAKFINSGLNAMMKISWEIMGKR